MLYAPIRHTLKDGRILTVRGAFKEDAAAMLSFLRRILDETDFMARTGEEMTLTVEEEEAFLQNAADQENQLMLVALHEGDIAGCCNFAPVQNRIKTRHRATMGISVLSAFSSQGLGRFLLTEALRMAKQAGFMQMELGVYHDNARALRLYRRLGFAVCGRLPRAFQTREGKLHDEILMVKDLSDTPLPMHLDAVVLDAPDVLLLRDFYASLLRWNAGYTDGENVAQLVSPSGCTKLLIQKNALYLPPVWPEREGAQQAQAHLDIEVSTQDDMRSAILRAKALGATEPACQYGEKDGQFLWYTLLDPAGHPFCFVIWP